MWKFFRKFIKKIKGPWPETSTGARMNPRTSLICGGLALVVMGLAAARVTYSLYDIQIKNGDTYRQLAAKQQLLDTTIKATRGAMYDTCACFPATAKVWTRWTLPRKRTRPSTRRFTMHFPRRTPSIRCWPPR